MNRIHLNALLLALAFSFSPLPSSAVPGGLSLTFRGSPQGPVVFDGTLHEKKRFSCDACHIGAGFQARFGADKITMASMRDGRFCGHCHNGKKAFSVATQENCKRCHQAR